MNSPIMWGLVYEICTKHPVVDDRRPICHGANASAMSELSPRFEPPEDRPKPTEPDVPPTPEPHADDLFADPERGVIDRVASTMERDERRGPEHIDASATSVIDRAAATIETDRPALEAVCNEVGRELHDTMPLDRWQAADVHERAELAQEAQDLVRERYGLEPRALEVSAELKEYELGEFDAGTGEVTVNERLLSEATPDELLNTIAHENQHAAQEEIMQGHIPHPLGDRGKPEVEAWREGSDTYDSADFRGKGLRLQSARGRCQQRRISGSGRLQGRTHRGARSADP